MGYGAIYQFVMFPDRVVSEVEVSWDSIKCVRSSERSERAPSMPGVVRYVCVSDTRSDRLLPSTMSPGSLLRRAPIGPSGSSRRAKRTMRASPRSGFCLTPAVQASLGKYMWLPSAVCECAHTRTRCASVRLKLAISGNFVLGSVTCPHM